MSWKIRKGTVKQDPEPSRLESSSIGFLNEARMSAIHPEYRRRHEYLIYLFQQIQDLVLNTQRRADRSFSVKIDETIDRDDFAADPLKYAASNLEQSKGPILRDISLALMADFLAFSHTSFSAFERRLFTPGYANLRKPLQENLMLLIWICGDPVDFLDKFCKNPSEYFQAIEQDKDFRKSIVQKADDNGAPSLFDHDLVEQLIYDKHSASGLAAPMHKAVHLWTQRGAIRTEEMNLNWIFKDPREDDVYQSGYTAIATVYMHAYSVIYEVCSRTAPTNRNLKAWLDLVLISCYEAIFLSRYPDLFKLFADRMRKSLVCMHCGEAFEFDLQNIPQFLMMEQIECASCGEFQNFPLYWMFCHQHSETDDRSETL